MMFFETFVAALALLGGVEAQCINQVAQYNPDIMTLAANGTIFILAAPKSVVQAAVNEAYPGQTVTLLDVPKDTTIFPDGFPEGMHPLFTRYYFDSDIRLPPLQINGPLLDASVYAPYVAKDGTGPLSAQISGYIGGSDVTAIGPYLGGLVPAVANPLLFGGNPLVVGLFEPNNAAWAGGAGGIYDTEVKVPVLPNLISGPGIVFEAIDTLFETAANPKYPVKTYRTVFNQPILTIRGQCIRQNMYFNNATATPTFRVGNITIGDAPLPIQPVGSGHYSNVHGCSACLQQVGHNPEDCASAIQNVDPAALSG